MILLWASLSTPTLCAQPTPPAVPVAAPGLHNVYSIGDRYYSGNAPESTEAFATLKKLGVKTIISVDGSKPDVEGAAKFGLSYVHLPFGYGGIPQTNVLRLIKAAQTLPGPIYVHCHHGLHRGPAAIAVICEGTLGWTTNEAVAWMRTAGTGAEYQGLYKAAAEFVAPASVQLSAVSTNFPQIAPPTRLVEAMVEIDKHWSVFKTLQKNNFQTSDSPQGQNLEHEALLLKEGFRELERTDEAKELGADFLKKLANTKSAAEGLQEFIAHQPFPIGADARSLAEGACTAVNQSCTACHKQYRN